MPRASYGGGGSGVIDRPPDAQMPGPPPADDDDWGYRCPFCNIDWPAIEDPQLIGLPYEYQFDLPRDEEIGTCPVCLETPHIASNVNPIPLDEAWSLKNHADFERFYEQTRGISAA